MGVPWPPHRWPFELDHRLLTSIVIKYILGAVRWRPHLALTIGAECFDESNNVLVLNAFSISELQSFIFPWYLKAATPLNVCWSTTRSTGVWHMFAAPVCPSVYFTFIIRRWDVPITFFTPFYVNYQVILCTGSLALEIFSSRFHEVELRRRLVVALAFCCIAKCPVLRKSLAIYTNLLFGKDRATQTGMDERK